MEVRFFFCINHNFLNNPTYIAQVEMKFNEPFFGIAYADFDRNSACQTIGKGEMGYKLELPLKGCGTKQVIRHNI